MKRKIMQVVVIIAALLLVSTYLWKVFSPNRLEYAINAYYKVFSEDYGTGFKIQDTAKWLNGELVAVEGNEMVGVVYLEKVLGIYKVKNHALCNKNDEVKIRAMEDLDYQYRLLRIESFEENNDVMLAYVKDEAILSFEMDNGSNAIRFQLPGNRQLLFSVVQQLSSTIRTQSDTLFVEWKDEPIQDLIKYNANDFICKSDKPLSIAAVGAFDFKTDESITIDNIKLDQMEHVNSGDYDALFINDSITDVEVDTLVKNNWDVFIIDPLKNLESDGNSNIKENVIVTWKGNSGIGESSKADFYDIKTNYFMAYSYIIEILSDRK